MSAYSQSGSPYLSSNNIYADTAADIESLSPDGRYISPDKYFSDMSAGYNSFIQGSPYQSAIDEGVRAVESSAASAGRFRSGTTLDALKDVGQGVQSQYFSNYMNSLDNIMGINENRYANQINTAENRRRDTQNINEQRYTNALNMGEQRDVRQQNVEEQRLTNYLNILSGRENTSNTARQNIAALGVDQGISMGNSASNAVAAQNQYNLGATAAQNAAYADVASGVGNLASAYISRPQTTTTTIGG